MDGMGTLGGDGSIPMPTNANTTGAMAAGPFPAVPPEVWAMMQAKSHEDRGPMVIAVGSVFMSLSIIVVVLRLYTRGVVQCKLGVDDYLMAVGTVWNIPSCVPLGYLGKHSWRLLDLPPKQIDMVFQMFGSVTIMNIISLCLIKSSILWFLLRLGPSRRMKMILYFTGALNISFAVIGIILGTLRCEETNEAWATPGSTLSSDSWNEGKNCVSAAAQAIVTPALNIAINVLIFSLPIPFIQRLDIPRKQKWAAIASFTLGGLGVVGSMVQFKAVTDVGTKHDPLWYMAPLMVWIMVEVHMTIIGSSLPVLRPLFAPFFRREPDITELETPTSRKFPPPYYTGEEAIYDGTEEGVPVPPVAHIRAAKAFEKTQHKLTQLSHISTLSRRFSLKSFMASTTPPGMKNGKNKDITLTSYASTTRPQPPIQTFDPDFFAPTPPSTPPLSPTDPSSRNNSFNDSLDPGNYSPSALDISRSTSTQNLTHSSSDRHPPSTADTGIPRSSNSSKRSKRRQPPTSFSFGTTLPLPQDGSEHRPYNNSQENIRYAPATPLNFDDTGTGWGHIYNSHMHMPHIAEGRRPSESQGTDRVGGRSMFTSM
ncbi:hypothetical protein BJ508DRAFT_371670 [Ascobolus immersus RN42]|uniref:Rhodopsin domain-containing protein n=1 Tax=Ascobolus immersus RN42 TaxID=1160509 RepID=A0A3N4IVH9_ASCIM|nr:hypothetical protein BJ508DRAFT_371670 [Ascobolus immersus RN42]